jgi:hypothetical protein
VLQRLHAEPEALRDAQKHQDLVRAIAVRVHVHVAREDPAQHLEPDVSPRRRHVLATRACLLERRPLAVVLLRAVEGAVEDRLDPGTRGRIALARTEVRALGVLSERELDPCGAPGKRSSSARRFQRSLSTSLRPPIVLADPCRHWMVVTPPARAR